ncbi:MAG TPA: PhzF family phenazine biosynthesis protein [Chloroflexia bacterium]|nr:PhzF family phenazine biosynthesis protein [Chloroflexia bacterium]
MPQYNYFLVDVFTEQAFGGNQLAVFTDAKGLDSATMQALAKELNLSETTFVLPPKNPGHAYWVRIFTPASEMPMAGHPTVGTSFVLARLKMLDLQGEQLNVNLEEGVGTIPVSIKLVNGLPGLIQMTQPLPAFGAEFTDRETIARMLSLETEDLIENLPVQVVSTGVPFLYVPLKNLQAVKKARLRQDIWQTALQNFDSQHVFIFAPEVETERGTVHSRMFAPALGIAEDPATGAASGPLGCYLVQYGVVPQQAGATHIVSEQGFEIGRPSIIEIEIEKEGDQFKAVRIGGYCHYMGSGSFELE